MIEVMRKLWAGGYVEHRGEFFDFPPLQLAPAPNQQIPIYIGGTSDLALRRAARLGQGWIGGGNDIHELPGVLKKLRNFRCDYGRENEAFDAVIPVMQLAQVEAVRRLEEQGMTSTAFGFSDYRLPLADKLKQLDAFAARLMPGLTGP
jgi:alkanesulfonate monooxygenase SsuD/methylene tetrahydromethanopterin reductase-like flavin-dependent oxidoreductase (luciferase family)